MSSNDSAHTLSLSSSTPHPMSQIETQELRTSIWIPLSAFAGISLVVALPLLAIRKQRVHVARLPLKGSTSPPPRKISGIATPFTTVGSSSGTIQMANVHETMQENLGERGRSFTTALSQMNASSALLAAKAFVIATGVVAVGGLGTIWVVKTTLGVQDTCEFGLRMRAGLWSSAPWLSSRVFQVRVAEIDDEQLVPHQVPPYEMQKERSWAQAEARLRKAYEDGGIHLWTEAVLREVETEARVERAKREAANAGPKKAA